MKSLLIVTVVLQIFQIVLSSRILAIIPTPSYSHQAAFRPLWRELARKGHEVVLLTTDPENREDLPNLVEIDMHHTYNVLIENNNQEVIKNIKNDPMTFRKIFTKIIKEVSIEDLEHPEVQNLIHNQTEYFDLVIAEIFFPSMYAFSKRFNCPLIGIVSMDSPSTVHKFMGNPANPVVFPDLVLPFYGQLSFKERMSSALYQVIAYYYKTQIDDVRDQKLINRYFPNVTSTMSELHLNMSMLFTNANPVFQDNRPLGPNTISFGGGTHINEYKSLPKDIDTFLNKATDGVVYLSLGSNVKSCDLDENIKKNIVEALGELPYKVLWKYEKDNLVNKPANVKTSKWLPQQDVLRHPNIKVFITQGGLQSMEESIYSRVPMIGLPFFGDQSSNVAKMADKGMGLYLDPSTMTKDEFKEAILEVMSNNKYRNKVKELAELAEDQPMSGLDKAVWWTEYVIRRQGAPHFKYPGHDFPLYQQLLLDVIGFLLLTAIVALGLIIFTIRKLLAVIKKVFSLFGSVKRKTE